MKWIAAVLWASTVVFGAHLALADQQNPVQRLARELGTPKLGHSTRNPDHSHSMFEYVPTDETVNNWQKLFTVVASRVDVDRTDAETRATIWRLRHLLTQQHAKVSAFDVRDHAPPVAYFRYVIRGEINVGVIFSPVPGIVTIQQVAAHRASVISAQDVHHIKALVGYPG